MRPERNDGVGVPVNRAERIADAISKADAQIDRMLGVRERVMMEADEEITEMRRLTKRLRRELDNPVPAVSAKVAQVVEAVSASRGVSAAAIMGPRGSNRTATARHEAMAVCRQMGMSYPEIGLAFDRDHTTVMYGVSKFTKGISI